MARGGLDCLAHKEKSFICLFPGSAGPYFGFVVVNFGTTLLFKNHSGQLVGQEDQFAMK